MTDRNANSSLPPITFGFPDFWAKVYAAHERQFAAIEELGTLANEMFTAAEKKATEPVEKVVLTRVTAIGMNDVLVLVGNGSGTGAMKIARGMFESSVVAEYLRRNPKEAEDYIDFGRVLAFRRHEWLLKNAPEEGERIAPEKVKAICDEYEKVKPKFLARKGRVRTQWSAKSLFDMAEELGRTNQYELPYSLGSSMHHVNAEGLLTYIDSKGDTFILDAPPSMDWVTEGLIAAHTDFLLALDTLSDCCKLGFDEQLKLAEKRFHEVWHK